jgi:transcriptional regulator with XRE-family HTH domain
LSRQRHDSPKEHRNAPGLTQRELGEEVGLTRADIARLEADVHDPPLSTIVKLARAQGLGVEADRRAQPRVNGDSQFMTDSPSCYKDPVPQYSLIPNQVTYNCCRLQEVWLDK